MTITKEHDLLTVGRDFVDCVVGQVRSHGEVTIGEHRYRWCSPLPISDAEHTIRVEAAREGKSISFFSSQAVGP